ncbi:MAG: hypothetical protein ACOYXC_12200 [Candidatus Rifleibacteriota bacterium]
MKKSLKIAGIALAAMTTMNQTQVKAETEGECIVEDTKPIQLDDGITLPGKELSQQKLIDALKAMKNQPDSIKFHSAMCYKMALGPDTFEYSCPDCGKITSHKYHSPGGAMARQITSIRRSFANLPAKITIDEKSLCHFCGKDAEAKLCFFTECGSCSKNFSWKITETEDLEKLEWLFLKYPLAELDIGPGRGPETDPQRVKKMVEFVSGCMFCPECIKKLELNY